MRTAIFVVAIMATQIGCTYWLSRQPAHLEVIEAGQLDFIHSSIIRTECHTIWTKWALYGYLHGLPAKDDTGKLPPGLCNHD